MLRAALDVSWQSYTPNEVLYASLPRVSDKIAWRRLGLAGHCFRHSSLTGDLILWEPRHGLRSRGRPPSTFVNTLKRDVGAVDSSKLASSMANRADWSARRAARLRPKWWCISGHISHEDHPLNCNVTVRSLDCNESAFYGAHLGRKDPCGRCGQEGADPMTDLKKRFKTVLPLCKDCQNAGIEAVTQRPFGKQRWNELSKC